MKQKLLFIKIDALGDNIIFSSIIPFLKEKYDITVLCQNAFINLYNYSGIEAIGLYSSDKLHDCNPDIVINAHFSRTEQSDFMAQIMGKKAKERIAFSGDCCNIYPDKKIEGDSFYSILLETKEEQELYRYKAILNYLGVKVKRDDLKRQIFKKNKVAVEHSDYLEKLFSSFPGDYIVICPRPAYSYKSYPFWDKILEGLDIPFVALGLPPYNTTILEAAEIIRKSKLVIGVDTGLLHMSVALNKPSIVLCGGGHWNRFFSPEDNVRIFSNHCEYRGCNWLCKHNNFHCVKGINYIEVRNYLNEAISKSQAKQKKVQV